MMDKREVSRRVAEASRLLVEGRRTIDRQRDLIARLERMGINSAKQHALLTILIGAYADREEVFAQLLDSLKSQPDQKPGAAQDIGEKVERDRLDSHVAGAKARLSQYIDSQR
jgi:hypothetical protein